MSLKTTRETVIDVQLVLWAYNGNRKLDLGILPQGIPSCLATLCKIHIFPPISLKTGWNTGLTKCKESLNAAETASEPSFPREINDEQKQTTAQLK